MVSADFFVWPCHWPTAGSCLAPVDSRFTPVMRTSISDIAPKYTPRQNLPTHLFHRRTTQATSTKSNAPFRQNPASLLTQNFLNVLLSVRSFCPEGLRPFYTPQLLLPIIESVHLFSCLQAKLKRGDLSSFMFYYVSHAPWIGSV